MVRIVAMTEIIVAMTGMNAPTGTHHQKTGIAVSKGTHRSNDVNRCTNGWSSSRSLTRILVAVFPVNLLRVRLAQADVAVHTCTQNDSPAVSGLGPCQYGLRQLAEFAGWICLDSFVAIPSVMQLVLPLCGGVVAAIWYCPGCARVTVCWCCSQA